MWRFFQCYSFTQIFSHSNFHFIPKFSGHFFQCHILSTKIVCPHSTHVEMHEGFSGYKQKQSQHFAFFVAIFFARVCTFFLLLFQGVHRGQFSPSLPSPSPSPLPLFLPFFPALSKFSDLGAECSHGGAMPVLTSLEKATIANGHIAWAKGEQAKLQEAAMRFGMQPMCEFGTCACVCVCAHVRV